MKAITNYKHLDEFNYINRLVYWQKELAINEKAKKWKEYREKIKRNKLKKQI